jgi:hypothetical protein
MTTALLERPAPSPTVADPDILVVVVRQEHIDRGVPTYSDQCAIALAVKEATGSDHVSMGRYELQIGPERWYGGADTAIFTYDFDNHRPVHPERFVFCRLRS